MPWEDTPCDIGGRTVRISTNHARHIIKSAAENFVVMHLCDNPLCGNPAHLHAGTQSDNLKDAFSKGRLRGSIHKPGEEHRFSKLTEQDVFSIRQRYIDGETQGELSKIYGVNQSTISRAISGKRWGVLGGTDVTLAY